MKSTMLMGTSLKTPSPSPSVVASCSKATSMLSMRPSSTIPLGVTIRAPATAAARSGSIGCRPISAWKAPTRNSRMEMVSPCRKNGRTRRSGFTPRTPVVSTDPSERALIEP